MIPILIVDTDAGRRATYEELLRRSFSIGYAADTAEALNLFRNLRPPLLIVHAGIEGGSGVALCHLLRQEEQGRKAKILLLGEDFDESILGRDMAAQLGADDLAGLPLDPMRLRRKLRDLITELAGKAEKATPEAPAQKVSQPVEITNETQQASSSGNAEAPAFCRDLSPAERAAAGEDRLALIGRLFENLEKLDYYALLGIPRGAAASEARRAYFAFARELHPDRFALYQSQTLRQAVARVFKRLNEAYQTLSDPEKSKEYQIVLERGESLRLIRKERGVEGPKAQDTQITNPQARKFYNLAMTALRDGKVSAAKMNLALAEKLAPGHPAIKSALEDLAARGQG